MADSKSDLNQLLIFVKVVDTRSFTAAGRVLGLPKSTISRKVAQLEHRLGVQLLVRTTRKLELTEIGAAFYERCARITGDIEEAEQSIERRNSDPHGLLHIAAAHALAPICADIIHDLLLVHTQLAIELELTERDVDVLEQGFDVALHIDGPPRPRAGVSVSPLGPVRQHLVASPDYIERHGQPRAPEDLARHQLLVVPDPRRGVTLSLRDQDGASIDISSRPRLMVNSVTMLRDAALAGVGVAMLPEWLCRADLDMGRLRPILRDWTRTDAHIHATYPTTQQLTAKLHTFLDELVERLEPRAWTANVATTPARHLPTQPRPSLV